MEAVQNTTKLLTDVLKRQIIILGPSITLAKARNVAGLTVADDGTVIKIEGDPQEITQKLVNEFMELSGEIVKKTMEPLLLANSRTNPTTQTPEMPVSQPTIQAPEEQNA